MDFDSETFVTHSLRVFDTTQVTSAENRSNPQAGGTGHPLVAGAHPPLLTFHAEAQPDEQRFDPHVTAACCEAVNAAVAFICKDYGADAGALAPTLRSMGHDGSHANGGGQVAVAFQSSQSGIRVSDVYATLDSNNGSQRHSGALSGMQVRRLIPRECERLQGFEDDYTNVRVGVRTLKPAGSGPCVKQTVTATVVTPAGKQWSATNHCMTPQVTCARAGMPTGEGYELCRSVCRQPAHAEVNAIKFAGKNARGATLYLEGHTYACEPCQTAARAAGIAQIIIGEPPGNASDGPRYKAIGNSWPVPVIHWIGERIAAQL